MTSRSLFFFVVTFIKPFITLDDMYLRQSLFIYDLVSKCYLMFLHSFDDPIPILIHSPDHCFITRRAHDLAEHPLFLSLINTIAWLFVPWSSIIPTINIESLLTLGLPGLLEWTTFFGFHFHDFVYAHVDTARNLTIIYTSSQTLSLTFSRILLRVHNFEVVRTLFPWLLFMCLLLLFRTHHYVSRFEILIIQVRCVVRFSKAIGRMR